MKTKVAILGSGNIGTDLMIKVLRSSQVLEVGALVGIDPESDGLARARRMGVPALAGGIDDLVRSPGFDEIRIIFDATSAKAHGRHSQVAREGGKQMVDLTPAAAGPSVVPVVNMGANFDAHDLSMVSCGGQATIPIVAAVSRVAPVHYAEIVASIASKSAGPGTRAQHRRVYRDHGACYRNGRRRAPGQGDHRAESGRAAGDHAEHSVLPQR